MAKQEAKTPEVVTPATTMTTAHPHGEKYPLITTAASDYPLIANGREAIAVFQENLAGQPIDPFSLTIIKVPSGGGVLWQVPTINGAESMKEIVGIVIQMVRRRAYWPDSTPSGKPPSCKSDDMETGVGNPGGPCSPCPFSQFGSSLKPNGDPGLGQACKEMKLLFMLVPGSPMPVILKVPPASLKAVLRFQTQLPVRFSSAIVAFGLNGTKNKEGTPYAEIVPRFVGAIPPEQAVLVQQFAKIVMGDLEAAADFAAQQPDGVAE